MGGKPGRLGAIQGILCDAVGVSGLRRRLGPSQKHLLENFEWEVGETKWKGDQACIGWPDRLLTGSLSHPVGHPGRGSRRKRVRPWRRFGEMVPARLAVLRYYYGDTS